MNGNSTVRAGMYHKGIGLDNHHKGIIQGGNKSLLSYRSDIGIPGYTGFIPQDSGLLIPTKGSTSYTGRVVDPAHRERLASAGDAPRVSVYADSFKVAHNAYRRPRREGGGYWITDDTGGRGATADAAAGSRKPFTAKTTYQAEVQQSGATAASAHGKSAGLKATVCQYAVARGGGAGASGGLVYESEYTGMVVKDPLVGGRHAAGHPLPGTFQVQLFDDPPRQKVLHRCAFPKFDGTTTYHTDFGTYGSDPLGKAARTEADMTRMATTAPFNLGTTKATSHIPGYSGFIAASMRNELARTQSEGHSTRENAKTAMLLSALDQYSRHRLPGYLGHRPHAEQNIREAEPPTTLTTTGKSNHDVWKRKQPAVDNANFLRSNQGTMSFFTMGSVNVSDNGEANAQRYYHKCRPREGLPRIHYPSKVTVSGYPFAS
mmetsp:Transcript_47871/g.153404  ORF Transcript_47871/g.153404 Transcript_47871/m.153404 type:complete len:432 (-) Transcript_47871:77-1372(-)